MNDYVSLNNDHLSPNSHRVYRFEGTCGNCGTRITSANGGATWRHAERPADKHRAYASGVISER